jgi:hypothetical protein
LVYGGIGETERERLVLVLSCLFLCAGKVVVMGEIGKEWESAGIVVGPVRSDAFVHTHTHTQKCLGKIHARDVMIWAPTTRHVLVSLIRLWFDCTTKEIELEY